MKKILLFLLAILTCPLSAHAKINVVATLPDFGSFAHEPFRYLDIDLDKLKASAR